jgi:Uma2 family endonuclease
MLGEHCICTPFVVISAIAFVRHIPHLSAFDFYQTAMSQHSSSSTQKSSQKSVQKPVQKSAQKPRPKRVAAHDDVWKAVPPNVGHIITEDDTPVDNLFSAKQQRLLVEPLYSSAKRWLPARGIFLADANVGLFFSVHEPPLVPDMFLSMNVKPHKHWHEKEHRTYFYWEFGKPPEVAVEVVSNRKGGELTTKRERYAQMFIRYYVVFDPTGALAKEMGGEKLHIYKLQEGAYTLMEDFWFEELGLGVRLWNGKYEGVQETWLRWCDERGVLLPTGAERSEAAEQELEQAEYKAAIAEHEREYAEAERQRAEAERQRAEREREQALIRAERFAAQLRALGIKPDEER